MNLEALAAVFRESAALATFAAFAAYAEL